MVGRRDNVERFRPEVKVAHPGQGPRRRADVIALQPPALAHSPFRWGVASGDPWPGGVVLWTRLALPEDMHDGTARLVHWELAADAAFTRVVQRGKALVHA